MTEPIIDTLLASDEPSIRWKTRVGVLGENPASRGVRRLQQEIRGCERVQALLARQDAEGRFRGGVYSKWAGGHWILAALADIGYPSGDRRLLPARDQLLDFWLGEHFYSEFECDSKQSSYRKKGVPIMQGRARRCASQQSSALYSVLVLGLADKRAQDLVERLLHWQWPDGGWNCDRNPAAHHSSFMESLLPLRALARVAGETGDRAAGRAAKRAAQIFLKRNLFKRQSDGEVIRKEFVKLHYPLYWHYDVLRRTQGAGRGAHASSTTPVVRDALDLAREPSGSPDGGWPADGALLQEGQDREASRNEPVDWGGERASAA